MTQPNNSEEIEKAAEEYATSKYGEYKINSIEWNLAKTDYLVGYQAALGRVREMVRKILAELELK